MVGRAFWWFWLAACLAGFGVGALIVTGTYVAPARTPTWPIQLLWFAAFLLVPVPVFRLRRSERQGRPEVEARVAAITESSYFRRYDQEQQIRQEASSRRIAAVPRWAWPPAVVTWLILFVVVASSFVQLSGNPEIHHGRYYADNHGALTPLTLGQYQHAVTLGARTSGGEATAALLGAVLLTCAIRPTAGQSFNGSAKSVAGKDPSDG